MPVRTSYHQRRKNIEGLSLVELMVSLLLGLLLASGIISVYLESKRNYAAEEESARIQENGRFALDLLKRELMLAGFYGGYIDVDDLAPQNIDTDCGDAGVNWALDLNPVLEFVNNHKKEEKPLTNMDNGTVLSCFSDGSVIDWGPEDRGTDILTVKRTAGEPTLLDGEYAEGVTAPDAEQWYMKIEQYGDTKTWAQGKNGFSAADTTAGSRVDYWEYYAKVFYIRAYSVAPGDGVPTLCMQVLVGNDMIDRCLVEGVEDMQLAFGIDTDGDNIPNQYLSDADADGDGENADDLGNVVSVRVYLLLRSLSEVTGYTNEKIYNVGVDGVDTEFKDGYFRRVFTTTVQTRNAILPSG